MNPLELTFATLAATENGTLVPLLRASLELRDREIAERSLQTILRCKPPELLAELVAHWNTLSERWREFIAHKPGVLTQAIRTAFSSSDEAMVRNAADAAIMAGEYELFSFLCTQLENRRHPFRHLIADTVVNLAEKLYEELHSPRNYEVRRDPHRLRHYAISALEVAASRYAEHRTTEVLEAFLLLAPRENATLRQILLDSTEPPHAALCDQLLRSTRPGVTHLLFSFLEDARSPVIAVRLLGQRRDVGFFRQLARKLVDDPNPMIDANLARIDQFPWIRETVSCVDSLGDAEQPGVVRLVAKSRAPYAQIEQLLQYLLTQGEPRGRQAAVSAYAHLKPKNIAAILTEQLSHGIPIAQAEAAKHLRPCDVPNALSKLVELLNSPHEVVRKSARDSLEELSFARYLAAFDKLTPAGRRSGGALVKRVNPDLAADLLAELRSNGRARRLRALEIAVLLNVVPLLEAGLIELTQAEDHALRIEATRLLGACATISAHQALRKLATDSDYVVQSLAEQALQELAVNNNAALSAPVARIDSSLESAESLV